MCKYVRISVNCVSKYECLWVCLFVCVGEGEGKEEGETNSTILNACCEHMCFSVSSRGQQNLVYFPSLGFM